jgi:hypothetical protein
VTCAVFFLKKLTGTFIWFNRVFIISLESRKSEEYLAGVFLAFATASSVGSTPFRRAIAVGAYIACDRADMRAGGKRNSKKFKKIFLIKN